ncbi:MAG: diguanylate cyclase, partial [Acidobacteriota bacterium]
MGTDKTYSGYRSWDYVRETRDFRDFDLIDGHSPFEPYVVPLDEGQERRAEELAASLVMISLHEHPHLFPRDLEEMHAYDKSARVHTAYEALADSWWDGVFDNFQDGTNFITSKSGWKWDDVLYDMGMR